MEKKIESSRMTALHGAEKACANDWNGFCRDLGKITVKSEAYATQAAYAAVNVFFNSKSVEKANDVMRAVAGTHLEKKMRVELELRLNCGGVNKDSKSNRAAIVPLEHPLVIFDEKAKCFIITDNATKSDAFFAAKKLAEDLGKPWFGELREYKPELSELAQLMDKLEKLGKFVKKNHAALVGADATLINNLDSIFRATGITPADED